MSYNDDFMNYIGFLTDGTGEFPDDGFPEFDEEEEEDD